MANYAYYCLHKLNLLPSQFLALGQKEKAFVIAAIDIKRDDDRKKKQELESKTKRG